MIAHQWQSDISGWNRRPTWFPRKEYISGGICFWSSVSCGSDHIPCSDSSCPFIVLPYCQASMLQMCPSSAPQHRRICTSYSPKSFNSRMAQFLHVAGDCTREKVTMVVLMSRQRSVVRCWTIGVVVHHALAVSNSYYFIHAPTSSSCLC